MSEILEKPAPARPLAERLQRLKRTQQRMGAGARERGLDEARKSKQAHDLAAMEEDDPMAQFVARAERYCAPLIERLGWTQEDLRIATTFKNVSEAYATLMLLEGVLKREHLTPPTKEEWALMKLHEKQEEDAARTRGAKEAKKQAVFLKEDEILQGLPIHGEDRKWAVGMLEAIEESMRDEVRQKWMEHYNDHTLALESDRYREANLSLLHKALKCDESRTQGFQKEWKKKIKQISG